MLPPSYASEMEMRADDKEASPRQTWFGEPKARDEGRRRAISKTVAMALYNIEERQCTGFVIVVLRLLPRLRFLWLMAHGLE